MSQADIDEFADLWALMYCVMAREMVDSFGEKGKEALIRAIQNYGKARGERLKKRHEEEGREINLRSLFDHYDLPGHSETEKDRVEYTDDFLRSYTHLCTHERIWRARACNDVSTRRAGRPIGLTWMARFLIYWRRTTSTACSLSLSPRNSSLYPFLF